MTTRNIDSHAENKLAVLLEERKHHALAIEALNVKISVVQEIVDAERKGTLPKKPAPPPTPETPASGATNEVPQGLTDAAFWVVNTHAKKQPLSTGQVRELLEKLKYPHTSGNFPIMLSTALKRLVTGQRINGETGENGWYFWAKS